MGRAKQTVRHAAKAAGSPFINYINRQFARMEEMWGDRIDRLENRLLSDIEANVELTASHARTLALVEERLNRLPVELASTDARAAIGRPPQDISVGIAEFANWIQGHTGFASQGHIWINQPLSVEHRLGEVRVGSINERIVEVPYVLSKVATLPAPARVFDFGSLESLIPLYLASLGHEVTALDLTPYPFGHPNITAVARLIQDQPDPEKLFDAIISLSTIEHIGLGSYGQRDEEATLDQQTMARFRSWLRPGGLLILTAPYGKWQVDEFQRVYDAEHLDALLSGFRIVDRRYAAQQDGVKGPWICTDTPPTKADRARGTAGVVLVTATPET